MNTFPKMHVSLYVSNIDRTIEFYEKMFDQRANKVKPGYAKFMLEDPALVISFVENESKVTPTFGHLGIQLQEDSQVINHLQRIKEEGLNTREEMGVSCCYAIQDKFWVADPDGHQWEFYYFHEDVEFNDPHNSAGSLKEEASVSASNSEKNSCSPGSGCC